MISLVIVNFNSKDADLLRRMKYNLEKAGFSLTEDYTGDVGSEQSVDATSVTDTLTLVYSKKI